MYIKIFPPKDPTVYMYEADSYIYEWSETGSLEFVEGGHHYIYIPFDEEISPDEAYIGKLTLRKGKDTLTNWIVALLGQGCTIYIMSDEGKTIDTILT